MRSLLPLLASGLLLLPLAACSSDGRAAGTDPDATPTTDGDPTPNNTATDLSQMAAEPGDPYGVDATDVVCPDGATFDSTSGFCVNAAGQALGPFPQGMIDACKANGGGATCDGASWPVAVAKEARNDNPSAVDDPLIDGDEDKISDCPTGTTIGMKTGLCTDGTYVYGPFDSTVSAECQANGGGASCTTTRFALKYARELIQSYADLGLTADGSEIETAGFSATLELATVKSSLPAACGDGAKLFNFYNDRKNFSEVKRLAKIATPGTSKRCATFLSIALQHSVDPSIPLRRRTDKVGSGAEGGIKEQLFARGWKPVAASQCQAGDVGFTQDLDAQGHIKKNPMIKSVADAYSTKAHSDHVFFVADNSNGEITAIDNRISEGAYNSGSITNTRLHKTPTAYCLRAPNASQGCQDAPDTACAGKADGFYCDPSIPTGAIQCKGGTRVAGLQCPTGQKCQGGSDGKAAMKSATALACK